MNLKNFMLMSLFCICKNNDCMEMENPVLPQLPEEFKVQDELQVDKKELQSGLYNTEKLNFGEQSKANENENAQGGGFLDIKKKIKKLRKPYKPRKKKPFSTGSEATARRGFSALKYLANKTFEEREEYFSLKGRRNVTIKFNQEIKTIIEAVDKEYGYEGERDFGDFISKLKKKVRVDKIDLEGFKNINSLDDMNIIFSNSIIDWTSVHEEIYQYLIKNEIIGADSVDVSFGHKIFLNKVNKVKDKLLKHMTFFYFEKEKKDIMQVKYGEFKQGIKDYIKNNYENWVKKQNNSFQEKSLINQDESNVREELLLNDDSRHLLNIAAAWTAMRIEVKNSDKNLLRSDIISHAEGFFWDKLRRTSTNENRINNVLIRKKISAILESCLDKRRKNKQQVEKIESSNFAYQRSLAYLRMNVKEPIFKNDIFKLLKDKNFGTSVDVDREVVAQYKKECSLRGDIIILEEKDRNLAKNLLLPENAIKDESIHEMQENVYKKDESVSNNIESEGCIFSSVVNECLKGAKKLQSNINKMQLEEQDYISQSQKHNIEVEYKIPLSDQSPDDLPGEVKGLCNKQQLKIDKQSIGEQSIGEQSKGDENKKLQGENCGVEKKIKVSTIGGGVLSLIDWNVVQEEVYRYLKENAIIDYEIMKNVGDVEGIFAGKNNKIKRKLLEHITFFSLGKEKKYIDYSQYKNFVQKVMQIVFTNYDNWKKIEDGSFQKKLLINKEKDVEKKLLGDKGQDVMNVAWALFEARKKIIKQIEINPTLSNKELKSLKIGFFWEILKYDEIKSNKINEKLLRAKIQDSLYVDLRKKKAKVKGNQQAIPIIIGVLSHLRAVIKSPIFYNDVIVLLKESHLKPSESICRKALAIYNREVYLRENDFIIDQKYKDMAEELLLPDEASIEKNNQNKQSNEMYESADEENEGACSDSESKEGEDSFRPVVNNCLIVKQQQGEEEQPVFQSEASEGKASENDGNYNFSENDGNYNFFEESSQQIGCMVMPKSLEEDSEEEKINQ